RHGARAHRPSIARCGTGCSRRPLCRDRELAGCETRFGGRTNRSVGAIATARGSVACVASVAVRARDLAETAQPLAKKSIGPGTGCRGAGGPLAMEFRLASESEGQDAYDTCDPDRHE